ncbi:uncharacterized protein [Equus caballus]|uniref:uncharacterized protein n=1 Tax=Equus caballus TaxID=9796 RepID=UPI0038B3191A
MTEWVLRGQVDLARPLASLKRSSRRPPFASTRREASGNYATQRAAGALPACAAPVFPPPRRRSPAAAAAALPSGSVPPPAAAFGLPEHRGAPIAEVRR